MEGTTGGVGPVVEAFTGVSRIAVLRGGGLGDLMFALPAVTALKQAYPGSSVTLLGTPLHESLLAEVRSPVDDVMVLPFAEGVRPGTKDGEEAGTEDASAIEQFFHDARARQFDLAIQLHGGGRFSNPFLLRLQARHTVGSATPDAVPLERTLPYSYYQHEPMRALEVAGLAGAPPAALEAQLQPQGKFVVQLPATLGAALPAEGAPLLVVHPGASDPRRRWPAASFGQVARAAADDGCRVLVVGDRTETGLAEAVVAAAVGSGSNSVSSVARNVASVAGKLRLGELAALLARADVVLANDSGPRHLAQALGTATVGIYWVGNALTSAPLGRGRHRLQLSWTTHCPVCGADVTQVGWTAPRCPHDECLVAGIQPADVYQDVRSLLGN